MIYAERHVITKEDLPIWVNLSSPVLQLIKDDSEDMLPWIFCSKDHVKQANIAIKNNYRYRDLFIFAYREDSDDVACFEKNKPGKVVIVHNWDEPGFEVGPEFISFDAWYNYALKVENGDHDYDNIPGIDFSPY